MNRRRSSLNAWLFLVPALAVYLAFVVWPIAQSFVISLFRWSGTGEMRFAGLDNFRRLAADPVFWTSLLHNVVLLVLSLVIQVPLALFLAVLLSGRVFARGLFRTVYFVPMILPTVVIGLVWTQFYLPFDSDGLLVRILNALALPFPRAGFLAGDANVALLAIVAAICWRFTGFHMVLLMAGIETIPEELYEAARIDGANAWQLFRHVTLPSISHVLRISAVLSIVGSLKYFDLVYVMTRGDVPYPHATDLVTTYMYKTAFQQTEYG
jgi:raffinose/stachyose/melibiose transport system permease protein